VAEQPELLKAMSEDETAGLKAVREAGGAGLFEEHMESMQRGAMPSSEKPAQEKDATTTPQPVPPTEEDDATTTP